jgi:hypothetical protein
MGLTANLQQHRNLRFGLSDSRHEKDTGFSFRAGSLTFKPAALPPPPSDPSSPRRPGHQLLNFNDQSSGRIFTSSLARLPAVLDVAGPSGPAWMRLVHSQSSSQSPRNAPCGWRGAFAPQCKCVSPFSDILFVGLASFESARESQASNRRQQAGPVERGLEGWL